MKLSVRWAIGAAGLALAVFSGAPAHATPISCYAISGNLIANCGFETGDFTDWSVKYDPAVTAADQETVVTSTVTNPPNTYSPHSGTYFALLGAIGGFGHLSQTFTDAGGEPLTVSFWLASDGTSNSFSVDFDGTPVSIPGLGTNIPEQGYTEYTFVATATGTDTLTFNERDDTGFLSLDDVSAVPEPASAAVLGTGILGFILARRRKRKSV